ncbi:ATPase, T2SS/T4P/T4SS family [Haloarchaeobius amylolyticus]|uniref:type II/IV secretion system ATPase subunit n=1 Tax=Haloarchaeobius amylolyticus TaxID=1198296 RepID=UPI0022701386|nr:ATPase, T2SS/T4P/T4SS family [Haloarchaeobius amylolyticus]
MNSYEKTDEGEDRTDTTDGGWAVTDVESTSTGESAETETGGDEAAAGPEYGPQVAEAATAEEAVDAEETDSDETDAAESTTETEAGAATESESLVPSEETDEELERHRGVSTIFEDGETDEEDAEGAASEELVRREEDPETDEATDAPSEELVLREEDPETDEDDDEDPTEFGPDDLVLWVEQRQTAAPRDIVKEILDDVKAYYASVTLDTGFAERPTDEFIEERWFDFSYLEDLVEVERYWVNRPYAYVSIMFDRAAKEFRYEVTEVDLDGFERYVREDLTRILRNSLMYHDIESERGREFVFEEKAKEIIAEHAATVEDGSIYKLLYYLLRDFLDFGKIDAMMRDENLEDISCDGIDVPVFVYHGDYRDLRSNVVFDKDRLNSFTVRLAQRAGKHISVSDPLIDASLPDGSRIQLTLGSDIATRGSNFTIRKFAEVPYTPVDLIKWNTFDVDQMAYFWLAIENNKSLVFAGGTGSGKTTSMNAIGFFIPPNSKVVSIEDTREITLPHDNWIQSVSRPAVTDGGRGEVSMYELLQASLRQRPEYLLVGEVRTEQRVALTFFNAIATGHTSYTTIHADSVEGALARLENAPLSVPVQMIQDLDVLAIQKQIFTDDTRVRRNQVVAEIHASDDLTAIETDEVFRWDPRSDEYEHTGDSRLLAEIASERGWTTEELERELSVRTEVLEYLVDNDITDYHDVTRTIHTFQRDRDEVLEAIRADRLDDVVRAEAR